MEKGYLRQLFLLMATGFVLVGCATDTQEAPEETETPDTEEVETQEDTEEAASDAEDGQVTATIDVVVDGETIADLSKEVTAEEGMYLLDVMEDTYDLTAEEGGFISEIEGYEQDVDAGRYWLYYINDEMPSVGAADYELEDGDHIEWRLEDSE
ncbi:MAG TPA: DUF4430 domain-containing protein [Atopostipes sp.]|nr:DUF4430 domain-containing protein [Atopostipes sp.]